VVARDEQQALDQIAHGLPHVVRLDFTLPKLTGLDILKRLHSAKPTEPLPVIVITAHNPVHAAVETMEEEAYDFLIKPLDKDHLPIVIRKALERDSLRRQVDRLRSEVADRYAFIVGSHPSITTVMDAVQRTAKSNARVLLLGESDCLKKGA